MAGLVSSVLLLASCAWIVVEAVRRAGETVSIDGPAVVVLAVVGLAVNGGSAYLLARTDSRQVGIRSAIAHLLADAAGSAAVLVAGLAVWVADATWVDTVVSLAIAAVVAVSAVRLLRERLHLLLEGVPGDLDPVAVEAALGAETDVLSVHHLHVWAIASDQPALSAHVQLRDGLTLHEAQEAGGRLKVMLHERFGIDHATLELECHPCDDSDHR
jgi:cobalt-zinc-cadmium efflux system protein